MSSSVLTINQLKIFKSLHQKKSRKEHGLFVTEGKKCIEELIKSDFKIEYILATSAFEAEHKQWLIDNTYKYHVINSKDSDQISTLQTPPEVYAIAGIKEYEFEPLEDYTPFVFYLDNINDPGNMGTIIRTAAWFGCKQVLCSPNCVDMYNPKVIQASMGACFRMPIPVVDFDTLESLRADDIPVYAADFIGENIYETSNLPAGILVIGSESHGISDDIKKLVTQTLTIPSSNGSYTKAESLNAAIAASILASEFVRKTYQI